MMNLASGVIAIFLLVGCGEAFTASGLSTDLAVDGGDLVEVDARDEADAAGDAALVEAAVGAGGSGAGGRGEGGRISSGGVVGSGGASSNGGAGSGGLTGTGGVVGSGGAPVECLTDLSGVGTGDFRISFTLTTTAIPAEYMALLNQRSRCDATRPGWDVWMTAQGNLGVQVFDGSGSASAYINVTDSRPINDGAPHRITVVRSDLALTIDIDDVFNTYPNEAIISFATLSPMNVGIDPTCTGVSDLSGRLIDVCLTKQ